MTTAIERIQAAMRARDETRAERPTIFLRLRLQSHRPDPVTIAAVEHMSHGTLKVEIDGKKVVIQGILLDMILKEASRRGYTKPEQLIGMRLIPEIDQFKRWQFQPERKIDGV